MRTVRETATYRRSLQKKRRCLLELQRLKTADRKADAHCKWLLGNLVVLADLGDCNHAELDQYLARVSTETNTLLRARWQDAGGDFFEKRQTEKTKKNLKSESAMVSKAAAHQRITLGGLFVKHGLETTDRAMLIGALLAMRDHSNADGQRSEKTESCSSA